ncbi:MAG: HAMP domain-containing protein [Methylococcaceae bacterium]|nr:HAMP domain-containing protein [Methylococcaceae bacterium]
MKFKLFEKLFLLFLSTMLLLLSLVILAVHFNFKQGLTAYLQKLELQKLEPFTFELGDFYHQENSWQQLQNSQQWFSFVAQSSLAKNPTSQTKPINDSFWIDIERLVIVDNENRVIVGILEELQPFDFSDEFKLPIKTQNIIVGSLIIKQNPLITDLLLLNFMESQLKGYLWIMALALALSLLLAFVMVRQILSPLKKITDGMRLLATGKFKIKIPEKGHDELAMLAKDFNFLSRALAQIEQARQQWLADISHELRTPLAILRGEIEALVDGVRSPTHERMQSLEQEILSLTRLVDDLYQLSLSDLGVLDYQFNSVDLVSHCKILVVAFQPRFSNRTIQLTFESNCENTIVNGDAMRLTQLISNLLENSYRYTDKNGMCRVRLFEEKNYIVIYIEDSAPNVAKEELPLLFERFHRTDKSRQRQTGGAGLGLAICLNIVKAHNGVIFAENSALGGVRIVIELPKV